MLLGSATNAEEGMALVSAEGLHENKKGATSSAVAGNRPPGQFRITLQVDKMMRVNAPGVLSEFDFISVGSVLRFGFIWDQRGSLYRQLPLTSL